MTWYSICKFSRSSIIYLSHCADWFSEVFML
jgi:hypothetical protein